MFDINYFDEIVGGSFEWDQKYLFCSFVIASDPCVLPVRSTYDEQL